MTKPKAPTDGKSTETAAKHFHDLSIKKFKEAGLRITQQRTTLIELLAHSKQPMSALEISKHISDTGQYDPRDQVSIYRILETLKELKLIHQVFPEGGYLACHHVSCSTPTHLLMTCNSCHSVKEIGLPLDVTLTLRNYLTENFKFSAQTHPLQIMGTCQLCM